MDQKSAIYFNMPRCPHCRQVLACYDPRNHAWIAQERGKPLEVEPGAVICTRKECTAFGQKSVLVEAEEAREDDFLAQHRAEPGKLGPCPSCQRIYGMYVPQQGDPPVPEGLATFTICCTNRKCTRFGQKP